MSEACQAGIQALGLELFSTRPAEGLTAFRVPDGLKEGQIRGKLTERFGITTVGGQEKLKGTIIRIGHMGYTDELDVISTLAALEMTLAELGFRRRARAGHHRRAAGLDRPERCRRGRLRSKDDQAVIRFDGRELCGPCTCISCSPSPLVAGGSGLLGGLGWRHIVYW